METADKESALTKALPNLLPELIRIVGGYVSSVDIWFDNDGDEKVFKKLCEKSVIPPVLHVEFLNIYPGISRQRVFDSAPIDCSSMFTVLEKPSQHEIGASTVRALARKANTLTLHREICDGEVDYVVAKLAAAISSRERQEHKYNTTLSLESTRIDSETDSFVSSDRKVTIVRFAREIRKSICCLGNLIEHAWRRYHKAVHFELTSTFTLKFPRGSESESNAIAELASKFVIQRPE